MTRDSSGGAFVAVKSSAIGTAALLLALGFARPSAVQPTSRLALELQDYAALPITADNTNTNTRAQLARVNFMRDEPGGRRFFVYDLNGPLYILDKQKRSVTTYLDFNGRGGRPGLFPKFTFELNFATGLTNFIFDPDYAKNGVFEVLFGDVWRRSELSARDRSLVTISVLIATGKPAQLAGHLGRALTNGVQPSEASGLLAHLAVYCGWPNAVSALEVYDRVYTSRKVDTAALRPFGQRLPAPSSDAARAKTVTEQLVTVAPKFVQLTNEVVFDDLWGRSDLSVRDRSLVTIAALAAMGDDDQLDLYVRRAIESGLTRAQMTEALTHLGFYAGWPKATKAITAVSKIAR